MRPYANDLRERVLAAVARGTHTLSQIADLFRVDVSCIIRWRQRQRQTGSSAPKPHAGGPHRTLDAAAEARLLDLVREQPDATRAELRDRLGVQCSLMTIFRALQRHRISRKKKSTHADERDSPAVQAQRQTFARHLAQVDPAYRVFVDETGATTAMTRTYGRAPVGERVQASAPGKWESMTCIVGLRQEGVVAPFLLAGATDQRAFETYVTEVLVPTLHPGDVVVWDNLQAHKSAAVLEAVQAAGATVQRTAPYSPDETPIEEMCSKVKTFLRSIGARSEALLTAALAVALDLVTPSDIQGWFHHRCSYAMH